MPDLLGRVHRMTAVAFSPIGGKPSAITGIGGGHPYRLGCGTLLLVGEIELSPDDPRLPGCLHELVRLEPLPGPGEILDVDVDERGVRVIDVAVDGSIGHAIAAALPGLRPVASKPRLEVFGFDTGHHLRHECLLAVRAVLRLPSQSRQALARYGHARSEQAGP